VAAPMVIVTRNLFKSFRSTRAVSDLCLEIAEAEIFGFLGPNGAGKTTTIRLLLGFLRPTCGTATVLGQDSWRDSARVHEEVGYLPGDARPYDFLTGREFLTLLARLRGRPDIRRGEALAERLGLDLSRRIKTYSRGTRQKLGIVQALQHEPRLIVLDEPTASLDPLVQEDVFDLLREERAAGRTVFFSSHVLSEVEKICDRVGIIRAGKLAAMETVEGLRARAARYVRVNFEGTPPAGFVLPGATDVEVDASSLRFTYRGEAEALLRRLAELAPLDVTIEPARLEEVFFDYYART
jgi:ABC-2 type transport system ATP-binding protein